MEVRGFQGFPMSFDILANDDRCIISVNSRQKRRPLLKKSTDAILWAFDIHGAMLGMSESYFQFSESLTSFLKNNFMGNQISIWIP